jgi:hypothetical protein
VDERLDVDDLRPEVVERSAGFEVAVLGGLGYLAGVLRCVSSWLRMPMAVLVDMIDLSLEQ